MIKEQRPDFCYKPHIFTEWKELKLKKTPYCEKCRIRTKDLIISFIDKPIIPPDPRYSVDNMISLCENCYAEAMRLAGCYNFFKHIETAESDEEESNPFQQE